MKISSLNIMRDALPDFLEGLKLEPADKCELMLNLHRFLDPENYEDNIKILEKRRKANEQKNFYARNNWNQGSSS